MHRDQILKVSNKTSKGLFTSLQGYYKKLCLMLCGRLHGRGVKGRVDTCTYMAESICCPPETITILLIGYTPV